ncbi:MAG: hypothetical protein BM557_00400 [Flavobacterium sp. MedPE-SWcel]|uniref:DUF6252 family protein n=1 Tax=uncultured Flavobacterium sp. TaxID=165435 RepID=UPI0009134830|nr:DUF6252 family protein [uncultured Flavobacterium sp.]OIQ22482.1 MAG: hypothetical protein BM557_00400 [Flavobacterium sp. MedPE-SWcel]
MKRIKILSAFLVLISALGFVSCDSEPVDPVFLDNVEDQALPASFQVEIDEELFEATATQAAIIDGVIAIQGLRGTNGESVSIAVTGTTIGTYTDAILSYSPNNDSDFSYLNLDSELNDNGFVTITSINTVNNTISGTFEFTGYWSNDEDGIDTPVVLTSGIFTNISYTGGNVDPDPTNEEYFTATVGSVDKDYSVILSAQSGEFLTLSGQIVSPASQVQLLMNVNITAGTYTIDGSSIMAIYAEGTTPYTVTGGQLTIVSNEGGWIKGEFEFTSTDAEDNVVEVTNGKFNIEL